MVKIKLGTKAETLCRLEGVLKKGIVLPQYTFLVKDWLHHSDRVLDFIQEKFQGSNIVVRSSSFTEDTATQSFAGAFESYLDISTNNIKEVSTAIENVIESYKKYEIKDLLNNQILIQPFLTDVEMSGVVMTRDLMTGAPYLIVNYDDQSQRTDSITSGDSNVKSFICFRLESNRVEDKKYSSLFEVIHEIEEVTGMEALDIEFAIDRKRKVYIFQVRPITNLKHSAPDEEILARGLKKAKKNFINLQERSSLSLYGKESIFANMPDWNPAEIIGVRPKPLAYSLYRYLIMDDIWRESRKEIGYHNPESERLMVEFLGQPYVDVRVSFNTMIPNVLPNELKEKLVNFYIDKLKQNPHLHDKVEFEILFTTYDFSVSKRLKELKKYGFNHSEIKAIEQALLDLTNSVILGQRASISEQNERLEELNKRRKFILSENRPSLYLVQTLLSDCKRFGTLPFSNLARYAFMAMSLLKSMVQQGLLTESQYQAYLLSIENVSTQTLQHLEFVRSGKWPLEDFLKKYGHLRPGTYDITSPRYDEAFDKYFSSAVTDPKKISVTEEFILSPEQIKIIDQNLKEKGFLFNSEQLFEFIEESIIGRESSKFEFSKNLSDSLKILTYLGEKIDLTPEQLQYVPIYQFLGKETLVEEELKECIAINKDCYEITKHIKLPSILVNSIDFYSFVHEANRPNYVTTRKVTAPILRIKDPIQDESLYTGKIIVIENADPGYDWIFSYPIAGLITKYGGANSHMSIRCAEFQLPAAIGCGELLFDKVIHSESVLLNCGEEKIETFS